MSLVIEVQPPVREWIEEVAPLFEEHYKEIAHYQDIPLDPDYEKYISFGELGNLLILTAKYNEELVGYIIYTIGYAPHYKGSLQASQDILFVKKGLRKSLLGCGLLLLRKSEEVLKEMGVQVIHQHVKVKHDFSPMLEKLGYTHVEKIYTKRID